MSYGNVYVAHVAMGADYNQCIKTFVEAESYDGPSIIVAYAPCISHGIKGGLRGVQQVVNAPLPLVTGPISAMTQKRQAEGKNPFQLDSKEPSASYRDFLMSEVRYNSLTRAFPDRAEKLFAQAEKDAAYNYKKLKAMAEAPVIEE